MADLPSADRSGSFSAQVWESIGDIYGAILAHPFITGLTDGTPPAERELHATLLADLGISTEEAKRADPAPTNLAYTSYHLATADGGSYAAGVGAVLPCYWIYWKIGKERRRRGSPDPRYQRWIDTTAPPSTARTDGP